MLALHYYKFPAYITRAINSKYYSNPCHITRTNIQREISEGINFQKFRIRITEIYRNLNPKTSENYWVNPANHWVNLANVQNYKSKKFNFQKFDPLKISRCIWHIDLAC